jgi:DNA-binding PadR family transcriptional regulator
MRFWRHAHDDAHPHGRHHGERAAHAGFGRHGPRGGRESGGREGREARLFEHGDLRLVIAALLAEKPRYGYEIIKEMEERVGGGYTPSPGVVYPTLTLLEELGHAVVSEERAGRKLYTLSPEGQAALAANQAAVAVILARIDAGSHARRGPPAPVVRALENLQMAVRLRLKGQDATPDQVRAIADAIDAAVRRVEEA